MTSDEWALIAARMMLAYPNATFTGAHSEAYFSMLHPYTAAEVAAAVEVAMGRSPQFIPPAPAVRAAIGAAAAADTPTFVEAYDAIYGRRGCLRLATYAGFPSDPDKDERAYARAAEHHPLLEAFVRRYGLRRLQLLEVDHPDYGPMRRAELKRDWDAHVATWEDRDVVALAGREPRRGLTKFDPQKSLRPPETSA